MKYTIIIDGGLGRVITSIPALEKFVIKNPDTNIIVYGWAGIIMGNKFLSDKIFDNNTKGIYCKIKDTKILKPEPYFNSDYLNGKISLIQAWNQEINGCNELLDVPKIHLKTEEIRKFSSYRQTYHRKIIAFQPFGSTANIQDNSVTDNTLRSLDVNTTKGIVAAIKKQGYGIWLITDKSIPFLNGTDFIQAWPTSDREMAAMMHHCDYFIGIDSSGQHIARSLNKPGTVIMGGTNTINTTYPDYFNIVNDRPDKTYMPYRVAEFDWWLSETINNDIMVFDDKKIKQICSDILKHIKKTCK